MIGYRNFSLGIFQTARQIGSVALFGCMLFLIGSVNSVRAQDCALLGGAVVGAECQISGTQTLAGGGTFNLLVPPQTLRILNGGSLVVPSVNGAPQTLTINIAQDLIMEGNAAIDGNASGGGMRVGATININANRDIILQGTGATGASITSNQEGGNCSTSMGGMINLIANADNPTENPAGDLDGDVTIQAGAKVTANARCPAGAIVLKGVKVTVDGLVESASRQTGAGGRPGGGPITIDAACDLTVTGTVSSHGRDPGADLVHLEGGCKVEIFGLVESFGFGHGVPTNPPNHCDNNAGLGGGARPDKPANSTACVEVWAGDLLVIDSRPPLNGEVRAETGNGGTDGTSWIDLFARGPISILGDTTDPFAVHANGLAGSNDNGGDVTVKSTENTVTASGLALQADATNPGGSGGNLIVEAFGNVTLDTASLFARGDFNPAGGLGIGGVIAARSFNGALSWQNGNGDVRPNGSINLTACLAPIATTGTNFNGTVPTTATGVCGGAPTLPAYVLLPTCVCLPAGDCLEVTKTCSCVEAGGGNFLVTIMGEVRNCGTTILTNVLLSDNPPALFSVVPPAILTPGQTAPYKGTFTTANDPSADTITATATTPSGAPIVATADATCHCTVDCPEDPKRTPDLTVNLAQPAGGTNFHTVQAAVDAAGVDDIIGLFSSTTENVIIGDAKQLIITQCTVAKITAADGNLPVVSITSTQPVLVIGPDTFGGTVGWSVESDGHELRGVRASFANDAGIAVLGDNNKVSWNSIRDGSDVGVLVEGDSNGLRGGVVENNGGNGVEFTATANGNSLNGATIRNNGGDGVLVDGTGNKLKQIKASSNAGDEFDVGPGNINQGSNKANGVACNFGAAGGVCN